MSAHGTVPAAHFDALYAGSDDPWNFRTSAYEAAKYDATLGVLAGRHYAAALELGCSIGVLTRRLAGQCGRVLAVDGAQAAVAQARAHCEDLAQVEVRCARVPEAFPREAFDLIVLSEFLYFFDLPDLRLLAAACLRSLRPGGDMLLVNWRGPTGAALDGQQAATAFLHVAAPRFSRLLQRQEDGYRLDLLRHHLQGEAGPAGRVPPASAPAGFPPPRGCAPAPG